MFILCHGEERRSSHSLPESRCVCDTLRGETPYAETVWTYRIALNPGEESETIAVLLEALRPAVWGAQLLRNLPEL